MRTNGSSSARWETWLVAHWLAIPTILISLAVLAWLQYPWSGEAAEGAQERTRQVMLQTAREIKEGLNRELLAGCEAFRIDSVMAPQQLKEAMRDRFRENKLRSSIAAIYLAFPTTGAAYEIERVSLTGTEPVATRPRYWERLQRELNFNIQVRQTARQAGAGPSCMFDGDILVAHHTL